jgi:WD40 repeat protein
LSSVITGRLVKTVHPGGGAFSLTVAFEADGTLASGDTRGMVAFWNPRTGRSVGHPALVAAAPVGSVAYAPSGSTFATTGGSDGLRLWTTSTEQQLGSAFPGPRGSWGNAQYTPDGSHLIVVYQDGKGFVWPTSLRAWEQHACAVAGRNLTREEWQRYVPRHSYARVCG